MIYELHPRIGVKVAPLVGAWIEIFYLTDIIQSRLVAPLVGAWIEILKSH